MTNDVRNKTRVTYSCRCAAVAVGSDKNLPQGWECRSFDVYGGPSYDAYLCADCVVSVNRQIAEIRNGK